MTTRTSDSRSSGKKSKVVIKKVMGQSSPNEGHRPLAASMEADREQIAVLAYALYQKRGYRQGGDLQDWLDAEQEILSHQQPA